MKLKVGHNVRMSNRGRNTYSDRDVNPHRSVGVIVDVIPISELPIKVKWDNGAKNSYAESEVEFALPEAPVKLEDYL